MNPKAYQDNGWEYKKHISGFIAKEKANLISQATDRGVFTQHIDQFLENDQVKDFDINNFI